MGKSQRMGANRLLSIVLVSVLIACAAVVGKKVLTPFPTLHIVNTSLEPVRVYANNILLANVMAGADRCVKLRRLNETTLTLRQPSSTQVTPEFYPDIAAGWEIIIGHTLWLSVQSIQPAEVCE